MVKNQVEKLVGNSLKFFHRVIYVHIGMTIAMTTVGALSLSFSSGSRGSTDVPYFFSIFISAAGHLVLLGISARCIYMLKASAARRKYARKWIMSYSMAGSIFVLWNVMGIVFAVVNGICNTGQLCYYDKNMEINRAMAASIIFLHSLTMVIQIFFSRKTHMYETEFKNDISIRLGHDWTLSRKASMKSVTSTGSFHSSRSLSSEEDVKHDLNTNAADHKPPATNTIFVIESAHRKWPPIVENITTHRSKSIPNIRKHPEMLEKQPDLEGGTMVSIYTDSGTKKTEEQKQKTHGHIKGHHRHRRSKSDSSKVIIPQSADQVASDFKKTIEDFGTMGSITTPMGSITTPMGSITTQILEPEADSNIDLDKKHKHKHKKHKKHKKSKKSKVMPEAEDETDKQDTAVIKAWKGAGKKPEVPEPVSDHSDSEDKVTVETADTLLQKQQKLQEDQAYLQRQQNELLMKQQLLLEQQLQQQDQLGNMNNPPPKYEETGHFETSLLPNQTLNQIGNDDDEEDNNFQSSA